MHEETSNGAKSPTILNVKLSPPFKSPLILKSSSSKTRLILLPLLLCSFGSQALSAQTSEVIQGSAPYLTFDNVGTRSSTAEGLLSIKLSDDSVITPQTNYSRKTNPIVLPQEEERFTDISMFVPPNVNSIDINSLIGPNNYWRDDDGDGQGANGIRATGILSVNITDKDDNPVNRNEKLLPCNAPYKVVLSSTNGVLSTEYGIPNNSPFGSSKVTYYINPKASPVVCFARPNLQWGNDDYAGPSHIWNKDKGFLVQSTYGKNFPTTGADKMYFYLEIGGIDPRELTWPTVTGDGIEVSMTIEPRRRPLLGSGFFEADGLKVTLIGPSANGSRNLSQLAKPALPQTFEIVGYDRNGAKVIKYGFVLKKWFVNSGDVIDEYSNLLAWCSAIGYRMPRVEELTNANCGSSSPCIKGASPISLKNNYARNIGAGLFTEWGKMNDYSGAGFISRVSYWTSDAVGATQFSVGPSGGTIIQGSVYNPRYAVCTY
ncbi:hypothetical protein A9G29_02610 [Gilliamella sp. Fer2-1]|jgi:hypothetical protein|uniref:hypothetical protein n=2 Tax=unclassified Gilliamella TaxID=2685620 RepID=UPI00080E835A|nr:hypothetical protein [Gilliamella apicola]OCG35051.1 hypothetical protein A9G29_02610 [Gilliamella apicola]OCG59403.1 hypothetical protein A9G40_07530 [Gilliamella apicola]OCG70125.1 hypothetical protein A9G41_04635 [Gilliamella apicola]